MAAAYLEESFEETKPTNNGYDTADWSETIASGCTVDSDNADIARPSGGGNQILKQICTGTTDGNRTVYTFADQYGDTWTTFYFRLNALSDEANVTYALTYDTAWAQTWGFAVSRSGGTYTAGFSVYYDGTLNSNVDTKVIVPDTWYKVDIKYDKTGTAWEWRFDDVSEGSGTLSGTLSGGVRRIYLNSTTYNASYSTTAYWDRIWIDDSEYGYGEEFNPENYVRLTWTR